MVEEVSSNGFRIQAGAEAFWLDPIVVFTRLGTALTLICEAEGLSRFPLPELVRHEECRNRRRGMPPARHPNANQQGTPRLTAREGQVLRLVRDDLSDPKIAEELGISGATMRRHLEAIRDKLEVAKQVRSVGAGRGSRDPEAIPGAANHDGRGHDAGNFEPEFPEVSGDEPVQREKLGNIPHGARGEHQ